MANKNSCVVYSSWETLIFNLPDEEAGILSKAILHYGITGEEIAIDNPTIKAIFEMAKEKLDEDSEKYQAKVDRAKNLKNNDTKSERNRNDIETKSKRNRDDIEGVSDTDTVSVTVSDTDTVIDNGYPSGTNITTSTDEVEVEVVKKLSKREKQFNEFWSVYPKKVGKKAAFNAFTKAKVDDLTFEKMLTAVERQKKTDQWQKEGGQFIPHPATWINQGRWDDEVVDVKRTSDYLMNVIMGGDINDTG